MAGELAGYLDSDPVSVWFMAAATLVRQGVMGGLEDGWRPAYVDFLDRGVPNLLSVLAEHGPATAGSARETAWQEVADTFGLEPDDRRRRRQVDRVVEAMLARLEATGVVARTGDDVSMTDLGRALALLFDWDDDDDDDFDLDLDLDVEVDLVDADAQLLLAVCADLEVEEAEEALADWCGALEPEEAAAELALAVEEDPELFTLARDAFSLLGPAAVGSVRRLQTRPGLRPLATFWLVKDGLEGPHALSEEDHTAMLVDMLAMLASSGDEEVVDGLEGLGHRLASS